MWPSQEQFTLWNHSTTTEMVDISFPNLCVEQVNKHQLPLIVAHEHLHS